MTEMTMSFLKSTKPNFDLFIENNSKTRKHLLLLVLLTLIGISEASYAGNNNTITALGGSQAPDKPPGNDTEKPNSANTVSSPNTVTNSVPGTKVVNTNKSPSAAATSTIYSPTVATTEKTPTPPTRPPPPPATTPREDVSTKTRRMEGNFEINGSLLTFPDLLVFSPYETATKVELIYKSYGPPNDLTFYLDGRVMASRSGLKDLDAKIFILDVTSLDLHGTHSFQIGSSGRISIWDVKVVYKVDPFNTFANRPLPSGAIPPQIPPPPAPTNPISSSPYVGPQQYFANGVHYKGVCFAQNSELVQPNGEKYAVGNVTGLGISQVLDNCKNMVASSRYGQEWSSWHTSFMVGELRPIEVPPGLTYFQAKCFMSWEIEMQNIIVLGTIIGRSELELRKQCHEASARVMNTKSKSFYWSIMYSTASSN